MAEGRRGEHKKRKAKRKTGQNSNGKRQNSNGFPFAICLLPFEFWLVLPPF
jgi:hypothetical protein